MGTELARFDGMEVTVKPGLAHADLEVSPRIIARYGRIFEMLNQLPGFRVLDGRFATEQMAMAIPKRRDLGMTYAHKFVEDAKSEDLVKAAIERAGLRGVVVAPLK